MHTYGKALSDPSFEIEKELISQGYSKIAGIDEAGRGALAGPLSIGLVAYSTDIIANPPDEICSSVDDSKRLSHRKRLEAIDVIYKNSSFAATRCVSHACVDRYNVNGATCYAIQKLLDEIDFYPDIILLDGTFRFNLGIPVLNVPGGDKRSYSIASASIAAKVRRDEILDKFDLRYPGYGFNSNKGYGTLKHRKTIAEKGPSPIHRMSFKPFRTLGSPHNLFGNENS